MARMVQQMKRLYAMCATALVLGRADLDGADEAGFDIGLPVFTVGQAGELTDIHPQTLRQYDRMGLVVPQRTEGGARRYSLRDIDRLAQAQRLTQRDGVNLAGVDAILRLQEENRQLRRELRRVQEAQEGSVFAAGRDGEIVELRRSDSARLWRRALRSRARQLPAGDAEAAGDRSVVPWGVFVD